MSRFLKVFWHCLTRGHRMVTVARHGDGREVHCCWACGYPEVYDRFRARGDA